MEEGHEGEGGEEEVAAAEGVDGPDGGEGEEEVNDAEAHGDEEGGTRVVASVLGEGRVGVVGLGC